jgi:hypothetical protein
MGISRSRQLLTGSATRKVGPNVHRIVGSCNLSFESDTFHNEGLVVEVRRKGQRSRLSDSPGVVHLCEVDVFQHEAGISNPSPCLRRLHRLRGRG